MCVGGGGDYAEISSAPNWEMSSIYLEHPGVCGFTAGEDEYARTRAVQKLTHLYSEVCAFRGGGGYKEISLH